MTADVVAERDVAARLAVVVGDVVLSIVAARDTVAVRDVDVPAAGVRDIDVLDVPDVAARDTLSTALRTGEDTMPDDVVDARGITFVAERGDTDWVVVVRVAVSRATTFPLRALVVRSVVLESLDDVVGILVARDTVVGATLRWDTWVDCWRFDATVVAAVRRVAARAISSASSAYAP